MWYQQRNTGWCVCMCGLIWHHPHELGWLLFEAFSVHLFTLLWWRLATSHSCYCVKHCSDSIFLNRNKPISLFFNVKIERELSILSQMKDATVSALCSSSWIAAQSSARSKLGPYVQCNIGWPCYQGDYDLNVEESRRTIEKVAVILERRVQLV